MIKNIVFDIGRVLLEFEPMEYVKEIIEEEALHQDIHDSIFKSNEWIDLDRGIISEADALERWTQRSPHIKEYIEKIMEDWCRILTPMNESIEIFKALKEHGNRMYLLSNYPKRAFETVREANSFFNLADGMVISYQAHMVKPDRDIYEHLLTKYALKAEETVFIDDTEKNIRAAQNAGILGIIFTTPEKLKADLAALNCL